jgi:hypothetical protein
LRIVDLAKVGQIPCVAIAAYSTVRSRQQQAEEAVVAEAKAHGLHPPEAAPRSFAMLGACVPGQMLTAATPRAIQSGLEYLRGIQTRRQKQVAALKKKYSTEESFRKLVDVMLAKLGAAENLELLLPYFAVGGELWPVEETAKLMNMEIGSVTEAALQAANAEAESLRVGLEQMLETRRQPDKSDGSRWWLWALGAVGVVGLGLGAWYAIKRLRDRSMSDAGDEPDRMVSAPTVSDGRLLAAGDADSGSVIDVSYEEVAP